MHVVLVPSSLFFSESLSLSLSLSLNLSLSLSVNLSLMGADGGTIPRRDELVTVKKKAVQRDPQIELDAKWKFCALSATPLKQPVFACELGQLFNKEPLLEALLGSKEQGAPKAPVIKHIKSWKDVHELKLTPISPDKPTDFVCPVSGVAMNGHFRFVYPLACGCVVSEKALREAPSSNCLLCGKPMTKTDLIVLNPPDEELKSQREAIKARKAAKKASKAATPGDQSAGTKKVKRSATASSAPVTAAAKKPTIMKVLHGADEELAWALSDKPIAAKGDASSTLKKLFHSSKDAVEDKHTYTSRAGMTKAYKWG
ncbi:uncharacterized protein MONBRDRAFT_26511 [Monosiga brevicollis MX1]|uniref:Uncharacterized protein n=1 Tax=Monosiga brevicollis TaxID=81824 RepID=A9V2K6_MONBE|nr:uncharacterized protein MONBRDRAFT_26511 [Monosiga brevicollis MX1]EDQ88274.1 predicted protein [Monosiga brevicollis MX1]|eukprot:XP_001746867.1 hypothetical protein [Monosiga brevicollis MX1]